LKRFNIIVCQLASLSIPISRTKAVVRPIRSHDLCHTAASIMLGHGILVILVSRILGHTKASVTLDIYGHLIGTTRRGWQR
jgi:integrase